MRHNRTASTRRGFSVVELLVAAAILGVLLAVLGSLYVSTRRSYDASERVSETRQTIQTATELLAYEIGLAGYRGVDVGVDTIATARPFSARPLTVVDGGLSVGVVQPDTVTVRYYEDRFQSGGPTLVTASYTVANGSLVRTEGSTSSVLVDDVTDFQVISWFNRVATEFVVPTASADANRPADADLAGIGLELRIQGRTDPYVVKIAFTNPQCQGWPCS